MSAARLQALPRGPVRIDEPPAVVRGERPGAAPAQASIAPSGAVWALALLPGGSVPP
jgi:hypothetical protein